MSNQPKRIVYLLGAGATNGEMDSQGIEARITMQDICREVLKAFRRRNASKENNPIYSKLFGWPTDRDIELVISLFEEISLLEGLSGSYKSEFSIICKELKYLFRNYLINQICQKDVTSKLTSILLHLNTDYGKSMGEGGEEILGIVTTNYDSVIEDAFYGVYGGLNVAYKFKSKDYPYMASIPPLLKLHGSFNWRVDGTNLKISKDFENESTDVTGWIPPSLYKKPSGEPFSSIWGKGVGIIERCDILRVIGSSLRSEDWSLVSMLFQGQLLHSKKSHKNLIIELIIPDDAALGNEKNSGVIKRLWFLSNMKNLTALPIYKEGDAPGENIFKYWLLKKIKEIEGKDSNITRDEFIINKHIM